LAQEVLLEPSFVKLSDHCHSVAVNNPNVAKENLEIMFHYFNETVGIETLYMQYCYSALANIKIEK